MQAYRSSQKWRNPQAVPGMSMRNPVSSAPMNNNPMGNQQTMTPISQPSQGASGGPDFGWRNTRQLPSPNGPVYPRAYSMEDGLNDINADASMRDGYANSLSGSIPNSIRQPDRRSNGPIGPDIGSVERLGIDNVFRTRNPTGPIQMREGGPDPIFPLQPPQSSNPIQHQPPVQTPYQPPRSPFADEPQPLSPAAQSQFAQTDAAMSQMRGMVDRLRPAIDQRNQHLQNMAGFANRPLERARNDAAGIPNTLDPWKMNPANPNGSYVNDLGGTSPRISTQGARNVLDGQSEGFSPDPSGLNILGTYYDAATNTQRRLYNPGGGYMGGNGIVPGSMPLPNDKATIRDAAVEAMNSGMSPDEFRVLTGGRAMIPPQKAAISGSVSGGELSSAANTRMVRDARRRGVKASDTAQWRALRGEPGATPPARAQVAPQQDSPAPQEPDPWRSWRNLASWATGAIAQTYRPPGR